MKHKNIVIGLAFAALFFAILLPPEAYADGKLAVILCATFAFFIYLNERRIHPSYLHAGLALFGFLLAHTAFVSIDVFRSLEFISMMWAYYCLFGFFLYAGFEPLKPFAVCMVVLSVIVSGYGVYQYFWGFEQLYDYAFYASTKQLVQTRALDRVATGRVFSTLALPGTLWGFLIAALPFHALLWRDNRWIKLALSASVGLLLLTGLLTRSFGFLVGLFVLATAWLWMRHRQLVWRLAPLVVVLAVVGAAFYSVRKGGIEGSNPFVLRAKNWVSAWSIFSAHPMGVGLNNYGISYSQHMLPGANETQYTHNTPLQLLSELGYPALILGAVLWLLAIQAWRRGRFRAVSPYVALAILVWGTHNLIDINVYFPSLGVIGSVLLALALRQQPSDAPQFATRMGSTATIAVGVTVLLFSTLTMISTELQYRAKIEYDENRLAAASATLEQARVIMPMNSSLFHDFGDINLALYHRRKDVRLLEAATSSFRQAIALSPEKVGPHIGLGLCLSSANRVDEALEEIRLAKRLQPDSRQVDAIARLMEKRNARASK